MTAQAATGLLAAAEQDAATARPSMLLACCPHHTAKSSGFFLGFFNKLTLTWVLSQCVRGTQAV